MAITMFSIKETTVLNLCEKLITDHFRVKTLTQELQNILADKRKRFSDRILQNM